MSPMIDENVKEKGDERASEGSAIFHSFHPYVSALCRSGKIPT